MDDNVVGTRELKTRLGTYLRRVRQGRTLVVTDRGRPVAEIRPWGQGTDRESALALLKAQGAVTQTSGRSLKPLEPVALRGTRASAALLRDRDDRF